VYVVYNLQFYVFASGFMGKFCEELNVTYKWVYLLGKSPNIDGRSCQVSLYGLSKERIIAIMSTSVKREINGPRMHYNDELI